MGRILLTQRNQENLDILQFVGGYPAMDAVLVPSAGREKENRQGG
jgi:hypothetical protein